MHLIVLWVNIAKGKPEAECFWFDKDLNLFIDYLLILINYLLTTNENVTFSLLRS